MPGGHFDWSKNALSEFGILCVNGLQNVRKSAVILRPRAPADRFPINVVLTFRIV